jgi:hypothetical protein
MKTASAERGAVEKGQDRKSREKQAVKCGGGELLQFKLPGDLRADSTPLPITAGFVERLVYVVGSQRQASPVGGGYRGVGRRNGS